MADINEDGRDAQIAALKAQVSELQRIGRWTLNADAAVILERVRVTAAVMKLQRIDLDRGVPFVRLSDVLAEVNRA